MKNQLLALTLLTGILNFSYAQVNDVGVSAINVPEFGTSDFTSSYSVQVDVTNYGSADQSNIPITLGSPGLNYSYYSGVWSALPDFESLTPVFEGISDNVDISIATSNSYFGFVWEGYIHIQTAGTYTFHTYSDDGSKLYIGGFDEANLVVNNDGLHGGLFRNGDYYFDTPGLYEITMTFFERTGGQVMQVYYESADAGVAYQQIPDNVFFTSSSGLLSETIGFIGAGNTVQFDFTSTMDFSENGSYSLDAFTGLSGDENSANDGTSKTVYRVNAAMLPIYEDFEGMGSFQTTYEFPQTDIPGLTGFTYLPGIYDVSRLRFSNGFSNGGSYSIGLDSWYTTSTNDVILTIDMSSKDASTDAIYLEFDYFDHNDEPNPNDKIFIRGSGGDDWIEVFDWNTATGFGPWKGSGAIGLGLPLVDNGQNFSESTQIRFGQEGYYPFNSDGVNFDNIEVFEKVNDVGIQMIAQSPLVADAAKTFSIDVTNFGSNTQSNFDITVEITDPLLNTTIVTETVPSINPLETIQHTFATTFDFSAVGAHQLVAYTSLAGDEDIDNDQIDTEIYSVGSYTGGLPLREDFEGTLNFYEYNETVEQVPGIDGFYHIQDGDFGHLYMYNYSGYYASGNRSLFFGAWSGGNPYEGSFYVIMDLSAYSVSSNDIGFSFNFLAESPPNAAYDDDRKVFIRGSETDKWLDLYDWNENIENYQFVSVTDLNISEILSDAGQDFSSSTQIRWGMKDNCCTQLVLDDIEVYEFPDDDLDVVDISIPDPGFLSDAEQLSVLVRNRGFNMQTVYDVQFEVEDRNGIETFVTESVNIPVAFGETVEYTFTTPFDFTVEGEYTVTATVILAGDENNDNDEFEKETGNFMVYSGGLPYFQDFEGVNSFNDFSLFSEIDGADGYNYVNDEGGRNEIRSNGGEYVSGTRALEIDREVFDNQYARSDIYLTADLSGYDAAADQIGLRFHFLYDIGQLTTNKEDRQVFVRGSKDDDWVVLYNWNDNSVDREFVLVYNENISTALFGAGQQFSSTFQVRFGHNQNTGYDFVIDDVYLYEIPGADLRVTDVRGETNPAELTANESFEVDLKNEGFAAQSNFHIGIELYQNEMLVRELQKFIAGPVGPGETLTYTIQNSGLNLSQPGGYELRVFPILPADTENEFELGVYSIVNFSIYSDDLPYFQNFEGVTVDLVQELSSPIDNLEGFSYEFDSEYLNQVELRFNTYDFYGMRAFMAFGDAEKSLGFHNTTNQDINRHGVIFTADLSGLDVNVDPMLLDYYFWMGYNYTSYSRAYIRGSIQDEWIEIRNHYSPYTNISWNPVLNIDLSSILSGAGQEFTSTFQIKWEHDSRYNYFPEATFLVDNINIYHETWGKELGIDLVGSGVAENAGATTLAGELYPMGDIPAGFTYSLVSGEGDDDNDHFYISSVNKLKVASNGFDYENSTTASVRVKLSNNDGYSIYQVLEIPIVDQNDAPDLDDQMVGTVAEGDPASTIVGAITPGTDPDVPAQTLTYEIVGTTAFDIDPNTGQITIDDPDLLDFETRPEETITVRVKDDGSPSRSSTAQITIDITDSNDPPTVPEQYLTMDRAVANATSIGFVDAFDEDAGQTISFALELGHSGVFAIDPATGEVTIADNAIIVSPATQSIYSVNVEVTDDAGVPLTTVFQLNVYVNEGPNIQATYDFEKEENGTDKTVGQVMGSDTNTDQTLTYSIASGNDDGVFVINSGNGTIFITDLDLFDFEAQAQHVLEVEVNDGGFPAGIATTTVTIDVLDTNDDPEISGADISVDENTASGTVIGTFNADDEDVGESASVALSDDASGTFSFDGSSGELTIEITPDFETTTSYEIEFTATDDSPDALTTTETFTISINNLNEAPVLSDATLDINENSAAGTQVGTISGSDVDAGQSLSYSIDSDPSGLFTIDEQTGTISIGSSGPDFESNASIDIDVTVTDDGTGNLSATATITIDVNDVNEEPAISVSDVTVPNTISDGAVAVTLAGSDPDAGQTLTYSIESGNGSGVFSLDAATGEITIPDAASFLSNDEYHLKVKVTDDGSPSLSSTTTFTILAELTFPVISDQTFTIKEGSDIGDKVGKVAAEFNATIGVTYSIISGNDDAIFEIDITNGQITLASDAVDFETTASYSLTVEVAYNDTDNNRTTATVEVEVEDVNERPELVSSIADWMLMVGDTDLSLDLSGNFSDPDTDDIISINVDVVGERQLPGWLTLAEGVLTAEINNELAGEYTLEVTARDQDRLKTETTFTLVITAVLGLDDPAAKMVIYPNPASHILQVRGVDQGELRIFSLSGKLIKQVSLIKPEQEISVRELPKGAYFIRLGEEHEVLKFIKQ